MVHKGKGIKLAGALIVALSLASCGGANTFSVVCYLPESLPFVATDQKRVIDSFATDDRIQAFTAATQDIVGVPIDDGLQAIVTQNWDYKLLRVTSDGNLWLVAIDEHVTEVTAASQIVVPPLFASEKKAINKYLIENANPDKVHQADQIREVQSVLASGSYQGQKMDFVVLPEPYVTITINDKTSTTTPKILYSISDMTSAETPYYQGGIFVKTSVATRKTLKNLTDKLDAALKDIVLAAARESIIAMYALTDEEILAKYGAAPNDIRNTQLHYDVETNEYINVNDLCYIYQQPDIATLQKMYGDLINEKSLATLYPGYEAFYPTQS